MTKRLLRIRSQLVALCLNGLTIGHASQGLQCVRLILRQSGEEKKPTVMIVLLLDTGLSL